MLRDWLNTPLFEFPNYTLLVGGVVGCVLASLVMLAVVRLAFIALNRFGIKQEWDASLFRFFKRLLTLGGLQLWMILILMSLHLNPSIIWPSMTVRNILVAGLVIIIARIADKFISARLLKGIESQTHQDIYKDQYGHDKNSNITRVVHYALFLVVLIIILPNFGADRVIHSFSNGDNDVVIKITSVLWFFLILIIARLLLWVFVNLVLYQWYKREKIDLGKQYAYNQLLSYVIYFFAILIALQTMGVNLTLLWAGAAALLVGIGIALQQVISDFFSGLVILLERSVEVGDFLDFGEYKGTVRKIGLRASIIETLEKKDVIIPNSHLVNDRVTNWSSTRLLTLFNVSVGVAYGSDTNLVKSLLIDAANKTDGIAERPIAFVRFEDFGASSLDFKLYFYSDRIRIIEDIKSNLRFEIDELFRANDVDIPFPQRTVWMNQQPE